MAGIVLRVKVDNSMLEQIAAKAPGIDGVIGTMASSQVEREAIRLAPVDTGYLKSQIRRAGQGTFWLVESGAHYAGWQEYGTRYQKGTPHMRPALEGLDWDAILSEALSWLGLK